jgi:hypothetical protein
VTTVKQFTIAAFVLRALMLTSTASAQESYTFISVDVQCPAAAKASACPAGLTPGQVAAQTGLRGVNPRGDVVGFYTNVVGGRQRGFVLQDGRITTIDFPIAGVRATIANGINARGEIVGQYTLPVHDLSHPPPENSPLYCPSANDPACIKGFYYYRGQFATVMFPDTTDGSGTHIHPGAIAQRITADGDIYGCVHDHDLGASMFGAAWEHSGTFSLLADGGQRSDGMAVPMSMNNGAARNGKTVGGLFTDMNNQSKGYLIRSGLFEPFDATLSANLTAIWDMNPNQHFVGNYRETGEPTTKRHGFVARVGDPVTVTLDFQCDDPAGCAGAPFGTVAASTNAFGINPDGVVVGQYQLVLGGLQHGFVALPPDTN